MKNIESIYEAYSCLADDKSRYVFCEQLRWRVLLNSESMEPPSPTSQLYVAPELISSSDNDVFVDCGAFDGDSIRQFLTHNCNKFRQIIALEPDSANFNKLRSWVNHLPVSVGSRITILPYALGEKRQKVQFDEGNLVGSRITKVDSDGGTDCAPLDEIVAHHKPTFIKMDIEGAEPHAILGARTVLTQHQPVLAACVYHKSEHLWQLPSLIHSISRSHEIYLRRYAEDCWELVCYAVPQHRIPTPSTY
ncbi:MAG TPA: FkbM family methyltransferase [Bryobacteraceae bacterium]|nr:FkbM family methyltransferase [Bryobacteraceae bacterium]